ncbi:MAG TPA: hypothetical protein VIP70_07125 [Nitrososphaeraceae archaeon]
MKEDKGQRKQEYKQIQLIKIAKSWTHGGTYVSLPKKWLKKSVNMVLIDDITNFIDYKQVSGNERSLVYATVKREWEGKEVLVTLVTNDERGSDKEKEIERRMLISRTLAAALKSSQPKEEEEEGEDYDPNKEFRKRMDEEERRKKEEGRRDDNNNIISV